MALDTAGLASAQLAPNSLAVAVETVSVSDNFAAEPLAAYATASEKSSTDGHLTAIDLTRFE